MDQHKQHCSRCSPSISDLDSQSLPDGFLGESISNIDRSAADQPTARERNHSNNRDYPIAQPTIPTAESTNIIDGFFQDAHHFVLNQPTFINGVRQNEKDFIDLLVQNTIPGAQFDSGERYPPPSCHPGTRLSISEQIVSWMKDLRRGHKVVWLHGPAGVGKSAVIQTLAESEASSPTSVLGATLFFSRPNERDDPQRVIITIAYQLAVKYPAYRTYVVELLAADPLLVKKSLVEQFKWLIVKPFAEKGLLMGSHMSILITLDGLDECKGESAQREIIFLVGKFCLQHPATPLIWIIATRPEPHICNAFSHRDIQGGYLGIDMPVNSSEACADVERYLRDKFVEIKENYSTSFSPVQQWPGETGFTNIANRSCGLFAFANAIVRFTDDAEYANPVAQLQKILDVLESPSLPVPEDAPFTALDALYTLILSAIPPKVLPTARRLLMGRGRFAYLAHACNMLLITQADAYSALRKLHSVLRVPTPEEAEHKNIRAFHTSFDDYLRSPSRSGSFCIDPSEVRSVIFSAHVQKLLESHNDAESIVHTSNISIVWPTEDVGKQQKITFQRSLEVVLPAPLEKTKNFRGLRSFFEDIDYANFASLLLTPGFVTQNVDAFLKSPLVPCFEEWGIIRTVPVQSLDLDFVSSNEPTFMFSDRPPPPGELDSMWEEAYLPRSAKKHVPRSNLPFRATWYRKIAVLRNEPQWRGHIRQQVAGLTPSHPVTVLGKDGRSLALIGVDTPEQSWFYMLPYQLSQKYGYTQ